MTLQDWEMFMQRPGVRRASWIVAALFAAGVTLGPDLVSYLRSSSNVIEDKIHAAVPLDFELDRAQSLIVELMPGIRQEMLRVADQQVTVDQLRRTIATEQEKVQLDRKELMALRNDPENTRGAFSISGREATPKQLHREMERRLNLVQMAEDRLGVHRSQLELREHELEVSFAQVHSMLTRKDKLQLQIEQLKSRVEQMQYDRTEVGGDSHDELVESCQETLKSLQSRLDVADRMLKTRENLQQLVQDSYVVEFEMESDITAEIDRYFQIETKSNNAL